MIPVVAKLLTITNVDDIILPSLAFIYFISQEPAAKIELVDTPEIDSLQQIIQSNKPSLAAAAQECFVRLGGMYQIHLFSFIFFHFSRLILPLEIFYVPSLSLKGSNIKSLLRKFFF